jgi:hypothetical protein
MRHRKKRQRFVRRRHRHDRFTPVQKPRPLRQRLAGRNRIEDDRRLRAVAEIGGPQELETRDVASRGVQPFGDGLLLLATERHAGDLLRRIDHLHRDGVGILRRQQKRLGHQRRTGAKAERHSKNRRRLNATRS